MRALILAAVLAALLALAGTAAQAHAFLSDAEPKVGATVTMAPARLRLHYTEGVEVAFSGVAITDGAGQPVAGVTIAPDPADKAVLVVNLASPLAPGDYKVSWHVVAVDTHKTQGDYRFTVAAAGAVVPTIRVEHAWARATVPGMPTSIVYATIANDGAADDRLIAAATPVAGTVELHRTLETNGVASMPPVAAIPVKAGGSASLAPGGYHIMLMDLKRPLKAGETLPLTLTFATAGQVAVTVEVLPLDATGPDAMPGMKM